MTYSGPRYSCPNFDNAIKRLSDIRKTLKEIEDWCDDAEEEIENARTINSTLRDDNCDLESSLETATVEIEILTESLTKERA